MDDHNKHIVSVSESQVHKPSLIDGAKFYINTIVLLKEHSNKMISNKIMLLP